MMKKQVAVVTGAGQEIGKEVCVELAIKGVSVVAADREPAAEGVAALIRSKGYEAWAGQVNIEKGESVEALFLRIQQRYGRVDLLVNASHINRPIPFDQISEAQWDSIMNMNLKSAFLCSQVAFRIMKRQQTGKIINISSYTSRSAGIISPGLYLPCAHYAAAKAALESLTRSVAIEGAPYGIVCNAVSSGLTVDDLSSEMPDGLKNAFVSKIPLARECTPRDIARAVIFLSSDKSNYITAKVLDVNGGLLMD
jgi:3-oxoacyl-[acyl-carrier protein] reductase